MFELPIPDEKTRLRIFEIHTNGKPLDKDVDLKTLSKETDGMAGSNIEFICRKASMLAIREYISQKSELKISKSRFEEAIKLVKGQSLGHGGVE